MLTEGQTDFRVWFDRSFSCLPGNDDDLIGMLYDERRLVFEGNSGLADSFDERSARLVAAGFRHRERLLVILPDTREHRPAFLLATGLIRQFLDRCKQPSSHPRPVLYFGSAVGIRNQLSRTSVRRLGVSLSEVFDQRDLARGSGNEITGRPTNLAATSGLPPLATVYAPADPTGILHSYQPSWIAVDCSDAPSLPWLEPILDYANGRRIPVIAWGLNPLSECVKYFESCGRTFIWPPTIQRPALGPVTDDGKPDQTSRLKETTFLTPILLDGLSVENFSNLLADATRILGQVTHRCGSPLMRDAVMVHWRYLRALESLAVPIDFHEAEAGGLWGLRTFFHLRATCHRFRETCAQTSPQLQAQLDNVGRILHEAQDLLERDDCALWNALINTCLQDHPSGEAQVLVFSGDSRKRLFLFGLLARENTTEEELNQLGIYVAGLSEFRRWSLSRELTEPAVGCESPAPPKDAIWRPLVVGCPGASLMPKMLPLLLQPEVEFILYPHQAAAFMARQADWTKRLNSDSDSNIAALTYLSGVYPPQTERSARPRLAIREAIESDISSARRRKIKTAGPLWQPADPLTEVAKLLRDEEESDDDLVLSDFSDTNSDAALETVDDAWCAVAIRISFEQGWTVCLTANDIINVVTTSRAGPQVEQRFVRSLRVGDRVLLIHGQQRQSLYDLVIARVHKHPSIELHLAMIRRWQEELRMSFVRWCSQRDDVSDSGTYGSRDVDGLLRRMQARGSMLVSPLTLQFWLRGLVLCPLDAEDLRRVAEILDMRFVRQYHSRIAQAATRLRGLHRGLSRRLTRWLQDYALGAADRTDKDVIDADLGLSFGDVRNSLLFLRVQAITSVAGPFLCTSLGHIEREIC